MINVDSSFAYLSDRFAGVTAVSSGRTTPKATKLASTATHREVNSVNWNTEKGKATLDIIEESGETIYDKTPEYTVKLTPQAIRKIKTHNNDANDGFLDKSLKCVVTDPTMEYVTCTSKYLDELRKDGIVEGEPKFESVKDISSYISGYNVTSARKSGNGPAWK